eukprot:RCo026243
MVKTVTVTYGPEPGHSSTESGLKHAKDKIDASSMLKWLEEGGASVDLKTDKTLKGKVTLYITDGALIEITHQELLQTDQSPNPQVKEKIDEFLYNYVSNQ